MNGPNGITPKMGFSYTSWQQQEIDEHRVVDQGVKQTTTAINQDENNVPRFRTIFPTEVLEKILKYCLTPGDHKNNEEQIKIFTLVNREFYAETPCLELENFMPKLGAPPLKTEEDINRVLAKYESQRFENSDVGSYKKILLDMHKDKQLNWCKASIYKIIEKTNLKPSVIESGMRRILKKLHHVAIELTPRHSYSIEAKNKEYVNIVFDILSERKDLETFTLHADLPSYPKTEEDLKNEEDLFHTSELIRKIIPIIKNSQSINLDFRFASRQFSPEDLSGFMQAMHGRKVSSLDMHNTNIGEPDQLDIFEKNLKSINIFVLYLISCKLDDKSMVRIVSELPLSLHQLYLGFNAITQEGIIPLLDKLPNSKIDWISVNDNNIGNFFGKQIQRINEDGEKCTVNF